MIAMDSGLPIHYDPFSTGLSAVVAITATWLTFGYEFIQLFLYRERLLERRRQRKQEVKRRRGEEKELARRGREERRGLTGGGPGETMVPVNSPTPTINITLDPTADLHDDDDDEEEETDKTGSEDHQPQQDTLAPRSFTAPSGWNGESGMVSPRSVGPDPMIHLNLAGNSQPDRNVHRRSWAGFNPSDEDLSKPNSNAGSRQGSHPTTEYVSPHDGPSTTDDRDHARSYRSESLATTFSNTSTESLPSLSSSRGYTLDGSISITSRASTGNSIANDPTISTAAVQAYAGGAMSLRMRQMNESKSGRLLWREILDDLKSGITRKVLIKGTLLGSSAFCMHYEGMRSMRLAHGIEGLKGGVEWSWTWVAISWIIACAASVVAIVFSELLATGNFRSLAVSFGGHRR